MLKGLNSITDKQAEILSNVQRLGLNGLTSINDQQAETLSKLHHLYLESLTSITHEQAESLSKVSKFGLIISEDLQPLIDKYKKQ